MYGTALSPSLACRLEGEPKVREAMKFFAAAPLIAVNGYRLGSL
jgi:hypothetical protein